MLLERTPSGMLRVTMNEQWVSFDVGKMYCGGMG